MLRRVPGFLSLVFCLAAFHAGQVVAQAPQYVVTDLGTLGGDTSSAYGINNLEQISGYSDTTNDATRHAFLFSNGGMTDLGTLGGDVSYGYSVSNNAHVTGYANPVTDDFHAYLYSSGTMHDIPGMGGSSSEGHSINSSDQIAGWFVQADGFDHLAFLYSNGMLQSIGTLGGTESEAYGINNSGQATGRSQTLGNAAYHAFVYAANTMTDIGTLGGINAQGYSINNAGQVTGFSSITGGGDHAFLYSGGLMNDLGTLGGTLGYGESINNSGQVTGHSNVTGDTVSHAFLYSGGTMYDLNSLVPASFAAYNIDEADNGNHLNDRGEVAAEGTVPATGNLHALLLTPRAMGTQFSGGLGELFGNIYNSSANSVANGGSVVVGAAEGGSHAAYWTLSRELTDLHLDSMSINAAATGVSADGRYVVGIGGNGSSISAFRYDLSLGQNSFLAAKSGDASSAASGTSADGSVTVGWSGTGGTSEKAVSWNGTNSPTLLGVLSGGTRSLAQSVSGDGSIITGYSQSSRTGANFEAFRWDSTNGMVGLGDLTGGNSNLNSQAFGISQDGTTIVGQANSNAGEQAFIWTQGTGMSGLGFISGTSTSAALGVSSDGSVVVGNSGTQAFVWDANHGIRNLQSILASEYGIVFAGWNLTTANGIAPDATEVVGQGTDSLGNAQAFAAQINSRTYRYMSGDSYVPFHTSHLGGHGTAVDILDGTAGGTANTFRTVTVATSKAANSTFVSDVANIGGTSSDTYVVQLSYDLAAANSAFGSDQSLVLGWFNGSSWVNALDGNSTGTPTFVGASYNHVLTLGNCSLDRVNHVVWACVNHGGQFAVINHVPPVANFSTWQAAYFTAQQLSDPTVSGASADPNHNGVPNLLEYAFNTNPLTGGALTNLPTAFHDPADSSYFAIVYTKFLGAADLTYTVQQSTDLSSWGTATTTNQILSDNGILQTIKAKVALTPGQKQLFLRLQVTH